MKKLYEKLIGLFSIVMLVFAYVLDKVTDNKFPWE